MSNSTDQEKKVAAALELAALATAAIKGLQIRGVRPGRGEGIKGTSTWAADAQGQEWQIYCPTELIGGGQLDALLRGLDQLAGARKERLLSFNVPVPKGIVNRKNGTLVFVFPALGGTEATAETFSSAPMFAGSLARALASLHSVNPNRLVGCGLPEQSAQEHRKELLKLVRQHAAAIPTDLRKRWVDPLRNDTLWQYVPCTIHGSLVAEDVQVAREGAVLGMKGFEKMRVGDPAVDVAGLLFHADERFLETFESNYARIRNLSDLHVVTRARLLAELETLRWYDAAVRAQDRQWRDEGVAALHDLDEDLRGTWIVEPQAEVVQIDFTAEEEPLLRLQRGRSPWNTPTPVDGVGLDDVGFTTETSATTPHQVPEDRHGEVVPEEQRFDRSPATDGSIEVSGWDPLWDSRRASGDAR